jgi:hypothetical protein
MKRTLCALLMAAVPSLCSYAAPVFQLNPLGGVVAGFPGATVGWGFTLTNTSNWLVVTGASFVPSSPLGTFEDFISTGMSLVVVGPAPESTTVTQAFNSGMRTGAGAFHINKTAPFTPIAGNIVLNYSLFSQDPNNPNFNPDTSTLVADATLTQPAQVNIVPEPGSLFLIASALPFVFARWRRKGRNSAPATRIPSV